MRLSIVLLSAALLTAPLAAHAAPLAAPALEAAAASPLQEAAGRCGFRAYYVPAHRVRGRIIPGHCRLHRHRHRHRR